MKYEETVMKQEETVMKQEETAMKHEGSEPTSERGRQIRKNDGSRSGAKEASRKKRQMRRDCRKFMRTAIVASFLHRLTNVAAPTVVAWMIGDMANHLLALDKAAIAKGMPFFLGAVLFQVVVAALFNLSLNLLLTKQGFAYDGFLMEKFIRLPLKTVLTADAGAVMERLEEDSAAFCWNQMILYAYPGAITVCAVVFFCSMAANNCHVIFAMTVVLLASLPIIRAACIGRRQTGLKKQASEYNETRKQMEQELFDAKEFARSFSLDGYFVRRLRCRFEDFLRRSGRAQYRMEAGTEVLNFLCNYGVQLGTVLVGAVLIARGRLTMGALLSGYLMIPAIRQCCQYVRDWVTEAHDEKKYLERLSFFYAVGGEIEDGGEVLRCLEAEKVSFTYPGADEPVLEDIDFHMTDQENVRIVGENGSGKTTLISILAGLYEPECGMVCQGASVGRRRKSIALQEQNGAIFSGTIWGNLFLPEDKRREATELLKKMGLEKSLDHETASEGANLSPGERKKLLLARALLRDVPFLVLDEPLNHLDDQGKEALLEQLVQRKAGLLLISHQDMEVDGFALKNVNIIRNGVNP